MKQKIFVLAFFLSAIAFLGIAQTADAKASRAGFIEYSCTVSTNLQGSEYSIFYFIPLPEDGVTRKLGSYIKAYIGNNSPDRLETYGQNISPPYICGNPLNYENYSFYGTSIVTSFKLISLNEYESMTINIPDPEGMSRTYKGKTIISSGYTSTPGSQSFPWNYVGPLSSLPSGYHNVLLEDRVTFSVAKRPPANPLIILNAKASGKNIDLTWNNAWKDSGVLWTNFALFLERAPVGTNDFKQIHLFGDSDGNFGGVPNAPISYTDSNLAAGGYKYRLRADFWYSEDGVEKKVNPGTDNSYNPVAQRYHYSTVGSAAIASAPPKLTSISPGYVSQAAAAGTQISISGTGFSPTGNAVRLQHGTNAEKTYSVTNISGTATLLKFNLPAGMIAGNYGVRASSPGSTLSNELQITVFGPPSNMKASIVFGVQKKGVDLSWTDPTSGKGSFEIERATDADLKDFKLIKTVPAGTTSYFDNLDASPLDFSKASYRVRVKYGNTASGYSKAALMASCVKFGGNGPIKILFMRGKSWNNSTITDLADMATEAVTHGFKEIEPLKKYQDKFSYYIDLRKYDDSAFQKTLFLGGTSIAFHEGVADMLKKQSSCNPSIGAADSHFFYFDQIGFERGVSFNKLGFSFFNLKETSGEAATVVHEFGHAFAGLYDEYMPPAGKIPAGIFAQNCSAKPSKDFRSSIDNRVYGGKYQGCTQEKGYYRASEDSLMNLPKYDSDERFNVISCGYVIAAIKDRSYAKSAAEKYWPECMTLDVAGKEDVRPLAPAPAIKGIKAAQKDVSSTSFFEKMGFSKFLLTAQALVDIIPTFSLGELENLIIEGTGFTPEDNVIQLVDSKDSKKVYEITEITIGAGGLVFTIPESVPEGTYTVRVGAFNSHWSNSFSIRLVRPAAASVGIKTWSGPVSVEAGKSFAYTLRWVGGPLVKNYRAYLHIAKPDGTNVATFSSAPNPRTTSWSDLTSTNATSTMPVNVAPGTYHVYAGLYEPGNPTRPVLRKGAGVVQGLLGGNPRYRVGTIKVTASKVFASPVTILPWTAPASISAGSYLEYKLNWLGGPLGKNFRTYLHIAKSDGKNIFTVGSDPVPETSRWIGTTSITYRIPTPSNIPPGTYQVFAGLYEAGVSQRPILRKAPGVTEVGQNPRYKVGSIEFTAASAVSPSISKVANITEEDDSEAIIGGSINVEFLDESAIPIPTAQSTSTLAVASASTSTILQASTSTQKTREIVASASTTVSESAATSTSVPMPISPQIPEPTPQPPIAPVPAQPQARIDRWTGPASAQAGKSFSYALNWNGAAPAGNWSTFIHISKDDGTNMAIISKEPATPAFKWTGAVKTPFSGMIPADVPPGTYKVYAGLFDPQTRERPALIPGSGVTEQEYQGKLRYEVGTLKVTAASYLGASAWDAILFIIHSN